MTFIFGAGYLGALDLDGWLRATLTDRLTGRVDSEYLS